MGSLQLAKQKTSFPIGIFDSGIGGLTVANAISKVLPNESLIYFGDTAHLPYGDKSPDSIKYYAIRISQLLLKKKCKMIVIACNTASSFAYDVVKDFVGNEVPVIDVINPVVDVVAKQFNHCGIGVIGTKGTIKSNVYAQKIHQKNKTLQTISLATPLLAPMIEEGFFNNNISRTIINSYLSRPKIKKIKALILACTHYPLIRPEIEEYYHNKVKIIDSAEIVADHVTSVLKQMGLLNTSKKSKHHFYVSDYTQSFEKSTKLFFKGKIDLEHFPLWEKQSEH